MGASILLRGDFGADELRRLAGNPKDADLARRLLALAAVCEGMSPGGGADRRHGSPDAAGLGASLQRTRP
jgi:hypothetical protein